MKVVLSFLLLVLISAESFALKPECLMAVQRKLNSKVITENFLRNLYSEQVLTRPAIVLWINLLEQGSDQIESFGHALKQNRAVSESKKYYRTLALEELLVSAKFSNNELINLLNSIELESRQESNERDETRVVVEGLRLEPKFVVIFPHEFHRLEKNGYTDTDSGWPLLVMDIPVTNYLWKEVTGVLPTRARDQGDPGEERYLNLPVAQISWLSAVMFANAFSKYSGVEQAYRVYTTNPENLQEWRTGRTNLNDDVRVTYWNRISFPQVPGFRLPTRAEMELLVDLAFDSNSERLLERGWFRDNTNGDWHPVGESRPTITSGGPIWDIIGTVGEWVFDTPDRDGNKLINKAYIPYPSRNRTYSFHSKNTPVSQASQKKCFFTTMSASISDSPTLPTGIRLVRTLTPEEYFELSGEEL